MRDPFGRKLEYVRISVTDRCNFRCRYCMPEKGVEWISHENILTYEDIFFLIETLEELGVKKLRFTGGEPLVRKGMIPFLEKVCGSFPHLEVALTTNGSTLTRHAPSLIRMGLSSLNVSLDTLSAEKFTAMTRGGSLQTVLDGFDALVHALRFNPETSAPQVKMNAVLIRGLNDDAIEELANFAFQRGITLRFIEFMPLDSHIWSKNHFFPFEKALARLSPSGASAWREEPFRENDLSGPARYYVNAATGQRVGVISAVSRHFCASCNRLRVTSTGEARGCLFSDEQIPLREALRARDKEGIRAGLLAAAASKPQTGVSLYRDEGHMHKIGG